MQKFFNFFLFAELLQRLVEYLWFCYCGGKHRGCSHGWICSKCSNLFYTPLNNFPVFLLHCSFIIWGWWVRETAFHGLHFPVGRMFTFCHHQSSITSYQGNFTVIILILESLLCWKAEERDDMQYANSIITIAFNLASSWAQHAEISVYPKA